MGSNDVKVPRLLRVQELVEITGIQRFRWYELFEQGKGPKHMRIGKTIRVPEDALVKWIEEQSTQTKVEQ